MLQNLRERHTASSLPTRHGSDSTLYGWYVVTVLVVAYTFSFLDRQILSLLVEPMKRDLRLSDTQISLLQGLAFASFNAIAGLPLGRLVDTRRRTAVIAAGIAFWSLMTASCGLARSYLALLLLRMGVGAGEATLTPAAHSMIGDLFPPSKVGLPLAVYSMGIFVGGGLALIIGAVVISNVAATTLVLPMLGALHGWQLVFLLVGLPGLLVALWVTTLREPKRTGGRQGGHRAAPLSEVWAYLRANLATFAFLNLGFAALGIMSYGLAAWIPTFFIREHGWSAVEIGHAYGLIYLICGPLGVLSGGLLGDLAASRGLSNPRLRVLLAVIVLTAPFLCFPLFGDARLALAVLAVAVFLKTFVNGLAPALLLQMVPNEIRGLAASASILVINLFGLGLGPTAIALVTDYVVRDEAKLGVSLVAVSLGASALGLALLAAAWRPYQRTLERLRLWNLGQA